MIGHTGFLITARRLADGVAPPMQAEADVTPLLRDTARARVNLNVPKM